jgi:cholesterol transport system auxiliary component
LYDDKRWTERPEVYVRRALARTLFGEHGIRRTLTGQAPALEVEVLSFEELRGRPPTARIQLRILLHDHRAALLEQTITVDRAALPGDESFDAFVHAMAQALDAAAEQVVKEVERALRSRAAQPPE